MVKVTVFTRENCQLCDQVLRDLESLQEQIPHQTVKIDIGSDPVLYQKYKDILPVVEIGPYTLKAPITAQDLQISLGAAQDGEFGKKEITPKGNKFATRLNRYVLSIAKHWLFYVNLFIFLYVGLPVAAPILMHDGNNKPAEIIYAIYNPMCHQLAYRSWFLYGEQVAYPIKATNGFTITYKEATGLDPYDLEAARDFIGNEQIGYKMALCQRDVAIYISILFFGLLFSFLRKRMKPLPMLAWFLVGIVPIALDGGTQLLSSLSLFSFLRWESTPLMRLLTGFLFGFMNAWMAFPYVEESMNETRVLVSAKLAGVDE